MSKNRAIPQGWEKKNLGEIVNINKNSLLESTKSDYQFNYIDISSVVSGHIASSLNVYLFETAPSRARRILQKDDVIMSMVRPNLKAICYIHFEPINYICSTGFAVLTSTKKIKSRFLYHTLFSKHIERQINDKLIGSNYPAINTSDFKDLSISLPPLAEQEKIAEILNTCDNVIENYAKILEHKTTLKKALMQNLLSGKVRLKGFSGKWVYCKAKDVFKNISIKNSQKDSVVLSVTQDKGVVSRDSLDIDIKYDKSSLNNYKRVENGNFIISLRSFQGGIEYSSISGIVSPAYTVIAAKKSIYNDFYKYYFKTADYISRLNIAVYGIRDGKQVSYEDFGSMQIPLPPLPEQEAIAEVLTTADSEIEKIKAVIAQYTQLKKFLMQNLLTGKIRVKI